MRPRHPIDGRAGLHGSDLRHTPSPAPRSWTSLLLRWALAALSLVIVAACGGRVDDREVVRFWVMGYEGEVVSQLMPDFERQNPGIRVEVQQLPWLSAHE